MQPEHFTVLDQWYRYEEIAMHFNTLITPWYVADRKVGGITIMVGWSEIALARGNTISAAMPPGGEDPFDGSLLDLLKSVS